MIKEAIEKLIDLTNGQILNAHGTAYSRHELHELPSPNPLAKPLMLSTITGVCDYIQSAFDNPERGLAILIEGPDSAQVIAPLTYDFRQREILVQAKPFLGKGFPYGRYIDLETFVVQLQACFVRDETVASILKLVGNITESAVSTFADDGTTQLVTAKRGIAKCENVAVPNPVLLAPYRTFGDIDQPASHFVMRLRRQGDSGMPEAALFESDDQAWKIDAMQRIHTYITQRLGEDIKVFA